MTDELIGKKLGQYEIIEEIGRGGMATVYRARQTSINRTVAVKVLPRNLLHDPGFYERFEREVDVVAHLEHPHILPVYDFGKAEGVPYIVMRYLGGGSLRDVIRRELPSVEALERPIEQISHALDYAHKQGIIHRDIKPGNVILDDAGNAYLSDFGIARVLGSELTGSAIIGTPAYMSPEQANGIPLDARSDVYSLGVVLFETLTGKEPFQAETPMALLLKHINEPMPPASRYRREVTPAVEAVIQKATAKNPDDRYASAGLMAKAFREALHASASRVDLEPTATYSPPADAAPTTRIDTPPTEVVAPAPPAATPQSSRLPLLFVGGLILILLVVVGGLVLPGVLTPPQPTPDIAATRDFAATQVALPPTPFSSAATVEQDGYSISIPSHLIPPDDYDDLSDNERLIHVWQAVNLSQYVALEIPHDAEMAVSEEAFRQMVDDYTAHYLDHRDSLTLIDEATAPDGSIRRSYRMVGTQDPDFLPGQLDVIFPRKLGRFAALHLYTADDTGNTLVPQLQHILDSLRVRDGMSPIAMAH